MVLQAFGYLNVDHPVVAWGVYRGVLVSVEAIGSSPNQQAQPVSMMFAGMIQHQNNARLQNELLIEAVRVRRYAHQVSRLSGMYFFTDLAEARAAEAWGGHFRAENLAELAVRPLGHTTRVDSNWITYAPRDSTGRLDKQDLSWIDRYWGGEWYRERPVWETIVHGRATVLGIRLRQRGYLIIVKQFPAALDMLEVARLAAEVDADLGQATAFIRRTTVDRYRLDYFLDMREAEDPQILERLATYRGPRNFRDLQFDKDVFGLPDFRPFSGEFTLSQVVDSKSGEAV